MSQANTVARPYAQAAFDEARRADDLKGWSDVLEILAASLNHAEVRVVIGNPRISKGALEELVMALCGNQLSAQQRSFVSVLIENHRLDVMPEILAMYEALRAEAEKFADVTVTSAFDLSEAQQQKIAAALKVRMQREIRLSCKVDKTLLGGVVIRAEDKVIDGSARTRLGEMANTMA